MAEKKISDAGKKVNNAPRGKAWSELKPRTKQRYKLAGVTPQKYNAWRKPSVQKKWKASGKTREQYLGLRPNQISGPSTSGNLGRAMANITRVFGDAFRFNARNTRRWLREISDEHVAKLAQADDDDIQRWADEYDDDFSDEVESTRNGSAGHSGGYLFYH